MSNNSNSEFDLEARVQITNEVIPQNIYEQMNSVLKNDLWKWLIGYEDVSTNIPYDGLQITEDETLYPQKIVNGKVASIYGDVPYKKWNATEDGGEYEYIEPDGTRLKLDGCLIPENDLFLHEIYRYLQCIYPDHPDWLNLLTRNEIIDAFNSAAAKVDYKPNNEFFKLVADSINIKEPDVEEFKINLRNLTNNSTRRKFYGSFLGYRMVAADVLQSISVFPLCNVFPLMPVEDKSKGNSGKIIDTFDERFYTGFRQIDWLGNNRDTSFTKRNGYEFDYFVYPGYPYSLFEFTSHENGKQLLKNYQLYKDGNYSFFESDGIRGSLSDVSIYNVLEYVDEYSNEDRAIFKTSDDKAVSILSSKKHTVDYSTLYIYKPIDFYISELYGKYPHIYEHILKEYYEKYAAFNVTSNGDIVVMNGKNNFLNSLVVNLEIALPDEELYTEEQYIYNPFIKDTISLSSKKMLELYDQKPEFTDTGAIVPFTQKFPKKYPIQKDNMISFVNPKYLNFEPYQVLGYSFGFIKGTFIKEHTPQQYISIIDYAPFDINDNNIVSKDNYGIVVETFDNKKVVMYGSLKFKWGISTEEGVSYNAANSFEFIIKSIPKEKSDNELEAFTDVKIQAGKIKNLKQSLISENEKLTHIQGIIDTTLPTDPTYQDLIDQKLAIENKIQLIKNEISNIEVEIANERKNRDNLILNNQLSLYVGCKIKSFFVFDKTTSAQLNYILDEAILNDISLGNISVHDIKISDKNKLLTHTPDDGIEISGTKFFFPLLKNNILHSRSITGQLISKMTDNGREYIFKSNRKIRIFNNETYNVEIESIVNNSGSEDAAYVINFTSEDAKNKFGSLTIGTLITGPGVEKETYISYVGDNSVRTNKKLSKSGTYIFKYECPITTSPKKVNEDPFNYKRLMYENKIYNKVSFFDKGVYGTKEWPNISRAIMEGDLKEFSILNIDTFAKSIDYLYGHKKDLIKNKLYPSMVKHTKNVFTDINIKTLLKIKNRFNSETNLMNVEWLDYIENMSNEMSLAKENINVGTNLILNADTSGYASLIQLSSYTDPFLGVLFQTIDWDETTIPAYVQVGNGGSTFKQFWKLTSNILYPNVYGASFWDTQRNTFDENNKDWEKELKEGGGDFRRRSTWSNVENTFKTSTISYKQYDTVDSPVFEIPLSEYNMNLLHSVNERKFSVLDILFYEQNFKDITKEHELKVTSDTVLYHRLFETNLFGTNTIYNPVDKIEENIIDFAKILTSYTYYNFNKDGELTLFINENLAESIKNISQLKKSKMYNTGCFGPAPQVIVGNKLYDSYIFSQNLSIDFGSIPSSEEEAKKKFLYAIMLNLAYKLYGIANISLNSITNDNELDEFIKTNFKDNDNEIYFMTYFTGMWNFNGNDLLNLKDFDIFAIYFKNEAIGSDVKKVVTIAKVNKNYRFCTLKMPKPDKPNQQLKDEELKAFYGYFKGKYTILNQYIDEADDLLSNGKFPIIEENEEKLKNSCKYYISLVINEINLPRKHIADGSYDINIIVDPKLIATGTLENGKQCEYNISQSAIKYDKELHKFYTISNGISDGVSFEKQKVFINFEEQKFFKNVKYLDVAYKVNKVQESTRSEIKEVITFSKIDGFPFSVTDLSISDKILTAKEIFLRSQYNQDYNSILFDNHYTISGEIYGIDEDNNLMISSKRTGPLSRISDNKFITRAQNILPGIFDNNKNIILKEKNKVFDDHNPIVVEYSVKRPLINSGYETQEFNSTFRYFKNLLLIEGYVNPLSSNVLETNGTEIFKNAIEKLSPGDTVISGVSFGGGKSSHTIFSNVNAVIKEVAYKNNKIVFLDNVGHVYISDTIPNLSSLKTINMTKFMVNPTYTLSSIHYDDINNGWIVSSVDDTGNTRILNLGNKCDSVKEIYNTCGSRLREDLDGTVHSTLLENSAGTNSIVGGDLLSNPLGDGFIVSSEPLLIPDVVQGTTPNNFAFVDSKRLGIQEYKEKEIVIEDQKKYHPSSLIGEAGRMYVKQITEGPVLPKLEDNKKAKIVLNSNDTEAVILGENLFAKTYLDIVEKKDGTILKTGSKTKEKHWARSKLILNKNFTHFELQTMVPDEAYENVNTTIQQFKSYYLNGVHTSGANTKINGVTIPTTTWTKIDNLFKNFKLKTYKEFKDSYDSGKYKVELPFKDLNNDFENTIVDLNAKYDLTATVVNNVAFFDKDYYRYLYIVYSLIFSFKRYETLKDSSMITSMFSHKDRIFIVTKSNSTFSIAKENLAYADNEENWEVSLNPMFTFFDDNTSNTFDSVKVKDGPNEYLIPMHQMSEIRTIFNLNTSLDTGDMIVSGGYAYSFAEITNRIKTLQGASYNESNFEKLKEYCQQNCKTPYLQYSNNGGISFNAISIVKDLENHVNKNLTVSSIKYIDGYIYAYTADANDTQAFTGKAIKIHVKNGSVDYEEKITYVDTIKENIELLAGSVTIPADDGELTYWPNTLGKGIDVTNDVLTFNLDYKGNAPIQIGNNLSVTSTDGLSVYFDKSLINSEVKNRIKVLLSIETAEDINHPEEFIEKNKLFDYRNTSGFFKVDTVTEVQDEALANMLYSERYINAVSSGSEGSIVGYPKHTEDNKQIYYKYITNNENKKEIVPLKNAFGNTIYLCNESGSSYLYNINDFYFEKFLFQIVEDETSTKDAAIAYAHSTSPINVVHNVEYMIDTDEHFYVHKDCKITEINTDGDSLSPFIKIKTNNIQNVLISETDSEFNLIKERLEKYIIKNESAYNTLENNFNSFNERFIFKNGYLFDNKYKVYILKNRRFLLCTVKVPYMCYNSGRGSNMIFNGQTVTDNGILTGNTQTSSSIFYHPRGYGGRRNNNTILETPWARDPAAFTDELLKNKFNDYVYLSDSNGELIHVYNSIQKTDNDVKISYDDFEHYGKNTVTVIDEMSSDKKVLNLYKVPISNIYVKCSSYNVSSGHRIKVRVYKDFKKLSLQDNNGKDFFVKVGNKIFNATFYDDVLLFGEETQEQPTKTFIASYINGSVKDDYEISFPEFIENEHGATILDFQDDEETIIYTNKSVYAFTNITQEYNVKVDDVNTIDLSYDENVVKVEKYGTNEIKIKIVASDLYQGDIKVLIGNDEYILPIIDITDNIYKYEVSPNIYKYFSGEITHTLDITESNMTAFDTKESVIYISNSDIDNEINFLTQNNNKIQITLTGPQIVYGLKGHCISKVPKYASFKELITKEGLSIESHNETINTRDLISFKAISDNFSECIINNKIDEVNSDIERYFRLKVLTISYQPLSSNVMNNEDYYEELSITDSITFPPDRVFFNEKGIPHPPINVNGHIFYAENNNLYYKDQYVNDNNSTIKICDEKGHYIGYRVSSDKQLISYRLDEKNDGDCSSHVYLSIDRRYVAPKPIYKSCQEWFKNNFYVEGDEVNPLWQIIKIKPILKNKKFEQKLSLQRFKKLGNKQALIDDVEYPYVNVSTITNMEIDEEDLVVVNEYALNIERGNIKLLLSTGDDFYKNNREGISMFGLHFKPVNIIDEYWTGLGKIHSTIKSSYTVNTKRDFTKKVQDDNTIAYITELGIFDKNHRMIGYANFPPIEYRTESQHISFTAVIYHGNMTNVQN